MSLVNITAFRKMLLSCCLAHRCIALVTVSILLASCCMIPQYPEILPTLVQADTKLGICPPIAGTFFDSGTAIAPDGRHLGSVSLTRLLHPQSDKRDQADVFLVKGPKGDVVEIESFVGQKRLVTWRQSVITKEAYLAKGDAVISETYLCQDGFVRLGLQYSVGVDGGPGLFLLGAKGQFLWLRKATDGSLIVLHTNYDNLVVNFVLPIGKIDKIWYHFMPAIAPIPNASNELLQGTHEKNARP